MAAIVVEPTRNGSRSLVSLVPAMAAPPRPSGPFAPSGADNASRLPSVVYWRRRVLVLVVALLALVGIGRVMVAASTLFGSRSIAPEQVVTVPGPPSGPSSSVHVVRPGDTVWEVARRLQPEGDVRPLVDQLLARTGGAELRPGQRIDLSGLG